MKKNLRGAIIMLSKYFAIGFLAQLALFSTLFGKDVEAQLTNPVRENLQNVSVEQVFSVLKKAANVTFVYDGEAIELNQKVSIPGADLSAGEVLNRLASHLGLVYKEVGNIITIKRKDRRQPNCYSLPILFAEKKEEKTVHFLAPLTKIFQSQISGTVSDSLGNALIGVTVQVKGTTSGTTTDANGHFTIEAPENATLVFSYVGYLDKEVAVKGKENINVIMSAGSTGLNELVVVGYGTQKKANLTGAVSTVSGDILENRPITNVGRGLQGQLPGLNITSSDGQPGRGTSFNVRGFTSVNGGEPYVLVDGVPTDINDINPADVKNVTVLKGAAAAAVYGARAPFGVILVTTKSGKKGAPEVSYNTYYSIHHITNLPDVVTDPATVTKYKNESYAAYYGEDMNNAFFVNYAKKRSKDPSLPAAIPDPNNPNANYIYVGATNWFDELYKPDNLSLKHNLSVRGGGDNVTYYFSGGFKRQNGVFRYKPDVYDRYNLRAKLSFKLTDWLTLNNNSAYNRTVYDYPSLWTDDFTSGDLYHEIGRANTLATVKNPDGSWTSAGARIGFLKDGGRGITTNNQIQNTIGFNASFFNGKWHVKGNYTFRATNHYNREYKVALPYEVGPDKEIHYAGHSEASAWSNKIDYQNINIFTDYENTFGASHYLKAMVGFNQEVNKYNYFSAQNNDLISNEVGYLNQTTATDPNVGGNAYAWALRGIFYRVNYSYKQRYLLELDGRYDGSSRFPPNDHYGFFPSASIGWRVSEEPFFRMLKPTVSNFKLRASYGLLGNDQSLGNYNFIPILASGKVDNILGGVQPTAVYPPNLVSPTLTWEKVYTRNFGVDLSFVSKIDVSFDVYRRDTKDMLTSGPKLPAVLGSGQPIENAADLKTLGWETSISYQDQYTVLDKPFNFHVRINAWDNYSIITRFNNPNKFWFGGDYYPGEKIGTLWGYKTLGIFQTDAEAKAWADESKVHGYYNMDEAGNLKFADLNEDGKIDYGEGTVDDPGDAMVIGNTAARYSFGGSAGFSWNNIDFSFIFQGIGKKDFWPGTSGYYWGQFFAPWENVYKNNVGTTWTEDNPNAFYPSMKGWRAYVDWTDLAAPQTRYIYSAAYVRLKNVTIGYTIPKQLLKKYGIDKLRIYFSGEDLLEFDNLPAGYDPEGLGGSWGAGKIYPFQRGYSLGLNLSF